MAGSTWVALVEERNRKYEVRSDYSHIALSVSALSFGATAEAIRATGAELWKRNESEGESLYFLDPDGHKLEIHASDLESRLQHMRRHPWGEITYYDLPDALLGDGRPTEGVVHVCDIHHFTRVAGELGGRAPAFMRDFYSDISDVAVSRGGQILEYFGDCMFFLFGEAGHLAAVESALAMRREFARLLSRYGICAESELENGISAGSVTIGTVGHPSHRVSRAFGTAVYEASVLGCHRGVAVTARVREQIGARYETRPLPDIPVHWREEPLRAWEIVERADAPGPNVDRLPRSA